MCCSVCVSVSCVRGWWSLVSRGWPWFIVRLCRGGNKVSYDDDLSEVCVPSPGDVVAMCDDDGRDYLS